MPGRRVRRAVKRGPATWLAAALTLACSADPDDAVDPASFAPGRVPVSGCEGFDYHPCDVFEPSCQAELMAIASCLRGGEADGAAPPISSWTESEAELDWLASLRETDAPDPDHFERALVMLGLTQPRALEPEQVATRLAQTVGAFYHRERQDVVIIEHEVPEGISNGDYELGRSALLLHELVHALQDRDHDLDSFSQQYRRHFDGNLRGGSVVEGEATLHERRYFASAAGLDPETIDLELSFDNRIAFSERQLMSEPDLYSASEGIVPYAHGAAFVRRVHEAGGQAAVRALFDSPPASTLDVLAAAWGGPADAELIEFPEPVDTLAGLPLAAWTRMGAWGTYLLGRATMTAPDEAKRLALAWRGDQLRAYELPDGETALIWEIELESPELAGQLAAAVASTGGLEISREGTRLRLSAGIPAEGTEK